jgi:hypothetical protein
MDHLQAENSMACERYLLDEMTEEERNSFEDHYFSCLECAEDLRLAGLMRDGARAGLVESRPTVVPIGRRGLPGTWSWRAWRSSVALPWAAAATLALALGYQTLSTEFHGSMGGGEPVAPVVRAPAEAQTGLIALAPVTLRPAARGNEPVVRVGQGDSLTLAVDLGRLGDSGFDRAIPYELKLSTGPIVMRGELTPPQRGAPLLVLIPAQKLEPGKHYVLSLRNPGDSTLTSEDYRFTVGAP